ncbi:tRNA uridine-5-carboxymethylaminomethyl(34) synthesis GTPase MnmE [Tardiphaga alba]|uniref:tRNA modification GTPase MnmE n=1 Tax=Tardiphaga alba TaxID=340268 RepID=A0ABX8A2X2_9BRAD|nr:tRNA uridine-5-carboxymethylaminomethyl(34) synthesis GTPase MnmE [Tardiphaga alba]QUS37592.1 tRNA uridine-5-carboxymethylaminomethyl(34) synthesis GTPase MnmE [Tardiphaga alba]
MHPRDQTIYALSSGRPPTAIAIVRVSGPRAGATLERLAKKIPIPRMATHVLLADDKLGPIDDAVVLWFPGPASATGEDTAEFHIHGGRAVLTSLFEALASIDGLRPAEPGEFTRRAFENGKLDLTEAEGLDDLIHADTDRQRRQALRQLKGLLGDKARNWRQQIIEALALVEVGIDFSDEGDVSTELMAPALEKAAALHREIEQVLSAQGRSERLRGGLVVAIAGQPNVGKSTLMNQLARRDVAIVSPHAGTTRDVIEVQLDLDGYPVTVIDTAGIRETIDPVEEEGVRRARARAVEADLVLWLVDSVDAARPEGWLTESDAPVWVIRTKTDVATISSADATLSISAERGDGMSELMSALVAFASQYFGQGEAGFITRDRQRDLLRRTANLLQHAARSAQQGDELVAEDLRAAAHQLGRLLGRVDVEDVLDSIFRDFCIGK